MGEILHFGKMGVKGGAVCAAFAAAAVLASSCVKRELYVKPDEGHVLVNFDWQKVVAGEKAPEKMAVYFYGDNGTLKREVVESGQPVGITLASGTYKVLTTNDTVAGVGFSNMENFDQATAYALSANSISKADGDAESWIQQPGWVYSASIAELTVNKEDTMTRTFVPEPLVRKVDLQFKVAGDTEKVSKVTAALTGVAPSVQLVSHECAAKYASIVGFTAKKSETDPSTYSASVQVFGVNAKDAAGAVAKNLVKLWVEFNNDENNSQTIEKETEVDLSSSTTPGPGETPGTPGTEPGGNLNINIELEVSATSEAGFQVVVKGWEVVSSGANVDNRPGGVPLASSTVE